MSILKAAERFDANGRLIDAPIKMSSPGYQALLNRDIPVANLTSESGVVRVIAGNFRGVKGPARTFTPLKRKMRRRFSLRRGKNKIV
jgi:redox-sensitive bicupin YhaK (pirin superfamily)